MANISASASTSDVCVVECVRSFTSYARLEEEEDKIS